MICSIAYISADTISVSIDKSTDYSLYNYIINNIIKVKYCVITWGIH